MKKALIIAAAGALLLAGCAQTPGGASTATAGSNRPSTSAPVNTPASKPTPTPTLSEKAGPTITPLGQTFTYENGLAVLVSDPQPYEPSSFVREMTPAAAYLVFDVTVVNGTPDAYEPIAFYATAQSDNVEAQQVFDSEKLALPPSTPLLPGRESKFKIAFGVANPDDLVLMIRPGFDYEKILYEK